MIEVAKEAWKFYGRYELEHWRIEDGHVTAIGVPERASKRYFHVFAFKAGPDFRYGERTLISILRTPGQSIRFDSQTGMPKVPRHLHQMLPLPEDRRASVWSNEYIARD